MKKVLNGLIWITAKIAGRKNLERLLIYTAKKLNVNLHQHALLQIGVGTGVYLENGSEIFFIKNILARQFGLNDHPLFFDVGANVGNFTIGLKKNIAQAAIYAFEPVKNTYEILKTNISDDVKACNIGFGKLPGKGRLYNVLNTSVSEIATAHKDVLFDVFNCQDEIEEIVFEIDTVDHFCLANNIENIDFLKIDVEGNELDVLQGAENMIKNNAVKIIQFEFNTHNIYSRVFLRDFYLFLKNFEFYRLVKNGMLSLGEYNPVNELFTAQNIIAVHESVLPKLSGEYIYSTTKAAN